MENLLPLSISQQPHHERQELCTTRPRYRQGRRLTSVKVYCVNDESSYLLLHGVPVVAGVEDVRALCLTYGGIESLATVTNYPTESFCCVYMVKFVALQSARYAKRKMDDKSFFGGVLHVCYAPELETLEDTRHKLLTRQREVVSRLCQTNFTGRKANRPDTRTKIAEQAPCFEASNSSLQQSTSSNEDSHATVTTCHSKAALTTPCPRPTPAKRIVYHKITSEPKKPRT